MVAQITEATSRTTSVSQFPNQDKELQDQIRKQNTKQKSLSGRQNAQRDAEYSRYDKYMQFCRLAAFRIIFSTYAIVMAMA